MTEIIGLGLSLINALAAIALITYIKIVTLAKRKLSGYFRHMVKS